jgi:hypothetical protein
VRTCGGASCTSGTRCASAPSSPGGDTALARGATSVPSFTVSLDIPHGSSRHSFALNL